MRWPLFTWMLAGGIFSMFWFLYLSFTEKYWKPVSQHVRRRVRHGRGHATVANA